jgi:hypothetical protein
MEAAGVAWGEYFVPNKRMLYASLVLTQTLYPRYSTPCVSWPEAA